MFKNYIIVFLVLLLTGCSAPGSALLGPVFTGAKTGSAAQASLSFGTNQIISKINDVSKKSKREVKKIVKRFDDFTKELDSKDFYASVKSLYLKDRQNKKKDNLFHR